MSSIGSPSPFFLAGKKAYQVERSLRFNNDDGAYLERTPSSAGNRKKWTFSVWIKRSGLGFEQRIFGGKANASHIYLDSNDKLTWDLANEDSGTPSANLLTSQVFRDVSAWFHLVCALDTDNSTADNRMKIYFNGTEVTSFSTRSNPSSGYATNAINAASVHTIGRRLSSQGSDGMRFDGYMAEINFIDGQALTPASFGETNAITGQWNPKKYVGSYGTNGFYLNFSDNSGTTATTLGKDSSGNGNNFTPNNFSVADGIDGDSFADTPTNNFCVLNAVLKSQSAQSLANGNLQRSGNAYKCVGTFLLKNNKYYFEAKVEDGNGNAGIGVTQADTDYRDRDNTEAAAYFTNGEYKIEGSGQTSGFSTYGNGDIIGVAIDTTLSTPKVWFSKNNVWQGTDDPTTAGYSLTAGKEYVFNIDHTSGGSSTAATAFFGGHKGEFNYTPPTGFVAASSANLPDPTILLPNKHFESLIYTGDSNTSRNITGLQFQPDWVWIKRRSATANHRSLDSVRGSTKEIYPNLTNVESTFTGISSFNSDGFTLATADPNYNLNSATYVAWNWNAGGTDAKTYKVKVVADSTDYGHGTGSNKYQFFKSDGTTGFGTNAVDLDLEEGGTYIFDWSDSSAQSHPIRFSLTNDGTHSNGTSAGTEYTTGVVKDDSAYKTTITIASGVANLYYYCQNHSGMGAEINTNTTKGSTNFDGSILSVAKANTTAGFSIVTYTGNGSTGTVGHGLGIAADFYIVKERTDTSHWYIYSKALGATKTIRLNEGFTAATDDIWQDTAPSSTVFYLSEDTATNQSSQTYIVYCFSEVAGYSKFGSYTGNGSSDGTFVFTGFRPAWVLVKNSSTGYSWDLNDNKRDPDNVCEKVLSPNLADAEATATSMDFLSNGFKLRVNNNSQNRNGDTFIYLAFAESPFKNARAR